MLNMEFGENQSFLLRASRDGEGGFEWVISGGLRWPNLPSWGLSRDPGGQWGLGKRQPLRPRPTAVFHRPLASETC